MAIEQQETIERTALEHLGAATVISGRIFLDIGRCFGGYFSEASAMDRELPDSKTLKQIGASAAVASGLALASAGVAVDYYLL
jgi:hypothetical protein